MATKGGNITTSGTGLKAGVTGIDVLNALRSSLPSQYQTRIPQATRENLAEYGQALKDYPVIMNKWVNVLVNKIGLTVIKNKMWNNKLAEFQRGDLPVGSTVEEIFVDVVKAKTYAEEPASDNLGDVFAVNKPDVKVRYHVVNSQLVYPISISKVNILQAFTNLPAFEDFISKIFESVYASANLDEYLQTKQLIQFYMTNDSINRFYDVEVSAVSNEATAKALATQIRAYSNKIEFMSAKYNYAGVTTHTPKEDQVLLLNSDTEAYMDVNVLAYAFNMEKADPASVVSKVVTLDDFGDGDTTTVAILVDRDWFMIYSQLYQMEEQNNALHLYFNRFLHIWKIYSTSEFANAIRFTTSEIERPLTITPSTATIDAGDTLQLETNLPATFAIITQGVDSDTTVDSDGLLTIAEDEDVTSIKVTATSTGDNTNTATGTYTIVPAPAESNSDSR